MSIEYLLLPILFLIGACAITGLTKALHILGRIESKKEFQKKPHYFFTYTFVKKLFSKNPWDNLFYLLSATKHLLYLLYAISFLIYFAPLSLLGVCLLLAIALVCDAFFRLIAHSAPPLFLRMTTPVASFFLLLFSPITFLLLKVQKSLLRGKVSKGRIKDKILELAFESELSDYLEPFDKRIISALASMQGRIAREIMVPRIDIFSLSINQTVHEAAQKFISEGYSRIPVYKENVDEIVGVLLYKDVIEYYFKSIEKNEQSPLETPLENLIKPVLYAPETKKIAALLQEFRSEQIHLAIIVDEYGGTEGVVTIEDILEELVGEIIDEHDSIEEEQHHTPHPDGGWVVDGKMTIVDIEKELGVSIPKGPEYDTIGGYVFHRAETIPTKGWKIHNDNFDLEVLKSSDRAIEKLLLNNN
ncbi:hemolysin family protein [Candidatus Neptunochlamydia vexilliferae]|uniref:CBS domain-containing protein n=1 Tax=Candidatus Neptunichlamydia vexilliferae TaxID=1651774 RepID=A0ABS0AZ54_9BACT|nr:hemolysin family protein [Candidatus Neptunochlamydia vexilliferae]MBF5059250.1 hypothetical protein [Candidatus Neptunochlamydia vexilliferae]